jgi:hypothetical protein
VWRDGINCRPPAREADSSATSELKLRSGRRTQSRKIPSAATASVSNGLIKERACFVAEFLAAQLARPSGGLQSRQQLYSQAVNKTADIRMKSMETAMYDMRRLLERLIQTPSN